MERIRSSCPPSSRTTVGPAASRLWPGSWAPGRQDRRLRQQGARAMERIGEAPPPSSRATCGPGLLCARFGHILSRATVGPGSFGNKKRAPRFMCALCPLSTVSALRFLSVCASMGLFFVGSYCLYHLSEKWICESPCAIYIMPHFLEMVNFPLFLARHPPPSSRTTVGPAASRPWPGPWVLRLAPAMPWALSGAPGREDRRLQQQGARAGGAGHPNGSPAAAVLPHFQR